MYVEIAYAEREPSPKDKVEVKRCPITSNMVIDRDDIEGDPKGFAIHINDGINSYLYYYLLLLLLLLLLLICVIIC